MTARNPNPLENQLIENSPAAAHWNRIGIRNHHGIVVPLFSLHTRHSCGIGEYLDLIPIIEWCSKVGLDVIQLLPLNDTGTDTSPYSSVSAMALNPIHISLQDLPRINDDPQLKKILQTLQHPKRDDRVDYPVVQKLKDEFLRYYVSQNEKFITAEPGYKDFIESNSWLDIYTVYKFFKDKNHLKSWEEWPADQREPDSKKLTRWKKQFAKETLYYSILQYLCFAQFEEVRAHAEKNDVFLKGDIPILINRDSADVWFHRHLFDLNWSVGAPPDMYSTEGQNWGVPLYCWEAASTALTEWWKQRLEVAQRLYHIYRIDHVVGFFRVWAVLPGQAGREGHFVPAEWYAWIPEGEKRMRMMLKASHMLPIGEDLGAVPPNIKACLGRLGICGTKVMRWERDWDGDKHYLSGKEYSPLSLSTISTHDSEPLRQWWRDFPEEAKAYCKMKRWDWGMKITPEQQWQLLADSHKSNSLFHINLLSEYLEVFPDMAWQAPEQSRINTPGIVSEKNWSVRIKPSVEEIVEHRGLKAALKKLLIE
ncbi:MAG: 4-alpha-glucanotransferase [Parachlamydiales bacterium]|jgi:4-alpha-glucanotransferase